MGTSNNSPQRHRDTEKGFVFDIDETKKVIFRGALMLEAVIGVHQP
jgi:hypothetical protein